jgi:xylulokinase
MSEPLFLGLDLSTQQLKAILINSNNDIIHESAVHFDRDLPHFKTTNGSIHHDPRNDRGDEVTVPVGLWIEALDELFKSMKEAGARLDNVLAIGGSAQVRSISITRGEPPNRCLV